jgi:hypothetical protein
MAVGGIGRHRRAAASHTRPSRVRVQPTVLARWPPGHFRGYVVYPSWVSLLPGFMITETLHAYKTRNFRQKNSFRDHERPDWGFYTFKSVNFLIAYLSSLRCARLRGRARDAAEPGPKRITARSGMFL